MAEKNEKTVNEQYLDLMSKITERAQSSGDIPETFVYTHNEHQWVLTLPRSVMAQKRLLHARNTFFQTNTYEAEEEMLKLFAQNAKVDGRDVNLNQLSMGEIEVLKIAYMDGLLLPLSLGGETAVMNYMKATVENLG